MKRLVCFLGNLFEHFDSALYSLVAPLIAYIFYPNISIETGLILFFLPYGLVLRPIGAMCLGYIGDKKSVVTAYKISLIGAGISAMIMAIIPSYEMVGIFSPIFLGVCRGLQSFFNAGQRSGAALILLTNAKEKNFVSSLYEVSGMLGYILATLCAISLALFSFISWRIFFMVGGLSCAICAFFPIQVNNIRNYPTQTNDWIKPFFAVAIVTGFSYANYKVAQTLMTVYMPFISSLKYIYMLYIYLALSLLDAMLLPLFGKLAHKIGKEKQMMIALMGVLGSLPIVQYSFIHPTIFTVGLARCLLILFGIMLAAPFQYWAQDHTKGPHQYRIVSLSKALGAQAIGLPVISISLWLDNYFHLKASCVYYLLLITLLSFVSVAYTLAKRKRIRSLHV